jgi:transposase-like protein
VAKKTYSDEDRANALAALAANAGDVKATASQLGMPFKTLQNWSKGKGINADVANIGPQKKKDLAAKLDAVAHRLADAIGGKIKAASLQQTAVALGITIEKARLLRDRPTSITQPALPVDLGKLTDEQLQQLDAILVAAGLPAPH